MAVIFTVASKKIRKRKSKDQAHRSVKKVEAGHVSANQGKRPQAQSRAKVQYGNEECSLTSLDQHAEE